MVYKHRKTVLELLSSIKDVSLQDTTVKNGLQYLRDTEHSMVEQDIKESYLYCGLCCDGVEQFIVCLQKVGR